MDSCSYCSGDSKSCCAVSVGRAWSAIRRTLWLRHVWCDVAMRVSAFVWGAALAGLAGVLFASWQRAIFLRTYDAGDHHRLLHGGAGGLRAFPALCWVSV